MDQTGRLVHRDCRSDPLITKGWSPTRPTKPGTRRRGPGLTSSEEELCGSSRFFPIQRSASLRSGPGTGNRVTVKGGGDSSLKHAKIEFERDLAVGEGAGDWAFHGTVGRV